MARDQEYLTNLITYTVESRCRLEETLLQDGLEGLIDGVRGRQLAASVDNVGSHLRLFSPKHDHPGYPNIYAAAQASERLLAEARKAGTMALEQLTGCVITIDRAMDAIGIGDYLPQRITEAYCRFKETVRPYLPLQLMARVEGDEATRILRASLSLDAAAGLLWLTPKDRRYNAVCWLKEDAKHLRSRYGDTGSIEPAELARHIALVDTAANALGIRLVETMLNEENPDDDARPERMHRP